MLLVAQTQAVSSAQKHLAHLTAAPYWDILLSTWVSNHVTEVPPFRTAPHPDLATFLSSRDHPLSVLSTALHPSFLQPSYPAILSASRHPRS